ncbi:MAG TPA: hypothetical protein VLA43_21345 [Longimicrobiales bacterium]|nr:hypothetical protein [Longimicrobiales bacterium]
MKNIIRETLLQVSHEGPAVPFSTLVSRLRSQGAAVTETVLARALEAPDSGARMVDPWCGPQAHLRSLVPHAAPDAGPWIIFADHEGDDRDPDPAGPACLRRSLLRLGQALDARSPRDMARWMALLEEARRLRPAA